MKWIRRIFQDFFNNPSSGRVMAVVCLIQAMICWHLGFKYPALVDFSDKGVRAFLWASAIFYGSAKVPEAAAFLKGNLGGILSHSNEP